MAAKPRHQQIADELREAILNEQEFMGSRLVEGSRLPTEPALMEHFGVAKSTIRQVLRRLTTEGLIEARGRHGTFVKRRLVLTYSSDSENPDRVGDGDTWTAVVQREGHEPSQDFSFRIVPASKVVAERLQVAVDDLVVVRALERHVDDIPWLAQESFYPMDVARECGLDTPHDIAEGTVRRMAARGYREIRMDHEVTSRPATSEEATRFGLGDEGSVLIYRRTAWTDERPVRLTCEVLPGDRNAITWTTERA